MAYIIQQRRDIAKAWSDTNPVLAPGEMGFIVELDENGKQKSSLYKMGDGKHAWNELPLFGFGGNVYNTENAWKGSDKDTSVASQQAVMDYVAREIATSAESDASNLNEAKAALEDAISKVLDGAFAEDGSVEIEGVAQKLSVTQLVQALSEVEGEFAEDVTLEDKAAILASQIVSRAILIAEFNKVWEKINENQELNTADIDTLKTFAGTYGPKVDTLEATSTDHETRISDMETTYTENFEIVGNQMTEHDRFIKGWTEIKEVPSEDPEGEPTTEEIYHKGVDEKIADVDTKVSNLNSKVDSMHQILTEVEYAQLDKTGYPDGTLFFTYKAE
jgi:hypothetical protein